MTTTELKDLTIGQVEDLIVEYVKSEDEKNKSESKKRKATQNDFDTF